MTGNILLDLVVSFVGITLLVALARWLFPGEVFTLSPEQITDYLMREEPDFVAASWIIDEGEKAALLRGENQQDWVIVREGMSDLVHRRFGPQEVVSVHMGDGIARIRMNDPIFGPTSLEGAQAVELVRLLKGQCDRLVE